MAKENNPDPVVGKQPENSFFLMKNSHRINIKSPLKYTSTTST